VGRLPVRFDRMPPMRLGKRRYPFGRSKSAPDALASFLRSSCRCVQRSGKRPLLCIERYQTGVDPVRWTPFHLRRRCHRCRRITDPMRRNSGDRWLIWSAVVVDLGGRPSRHRSDWRGRDYPRHPGPLRPVGRARMTRPFPPVRGCCAPLAHGPRRAFSWWRR
jgi:hypothetical protein